MRRQDKIANARSHIATCRFYCGTHIATGGGKRASATSSPGAALIRLAQKLFPAAEASISPLASVGSSNSYRITKINGSK